MKAPVILFFLLFGTYVTYSQIAPVCQVLTTADGLSDGMVTDILQSRDGFIWIATKDGLNRYDGARFKVFSHDPFNPYSIGAGAIQNIFEDSRGWIWVALPEALDVLDPVSGRFFHVKHKDQAIFSRWTGSMAETPDGTIWFSDEDRIWKITIPKDMLARAAKQGNAILEPPCKIILMSGVSGWSGPALKANYLFFTSGQKLLIGTEQGLFRLDPATDQVLPELPIQGCEIETISESKSGVILAKGNRYGPHIWIRIEGDEVRYRQDELADYPFGSINIVQVDEAYFWMFRGRSFQKWKITTFFDQGKPELETGSDALPSGNKEEYAGTCYTADKSGIIWAGTNGFGVVKISMETPKFKTLLPGESHDILLEGPDGGLYSSGKFDKKFLSSHFDASVPNIDVLLRLGSNHSAKPLAFDAKGNAWCLTYKKILLQIDAATKTEKRFPLEGDALICNRNGLLVSVSDKGLHEFDPASESSQHFLFDKPQQRRADNAQFLYEDSEGALWIFGYEGLIKAARSGSGYRFEYFINNPQDRSSLSSNVVLCVVDDPIDPRQYLWMGTDGGGLNRLDKQSGKFKYFTRQQGLPSNVVNGILAQDHPQNTQVPGFIWMSTDLGLCRFDVRAETAGNFTVEDGLQDNAFTSGSYLKTKDGALIFGGDFGLNVFHPDSLPFNKNAPQTHITGLQVNNQEYDLAGRPSIALSHDQNQITIDFAALEFSNPAQNKYRYQLEGLAKDWVSLGTKNSIQFAGLAPGAYTFRVIGSNNDGIWSEQPAELRFTIHPPWWASWWAYLLYIALAATGVWFYYQYLLRRQFSEQEKLRLQELDDFKSRFFTNITHEFRTPLTVILGMSEQVLRDKITQSNPANIAQPLGLIKRNGENLLRLVNQILDLAKLESNTLKMNYIQGDILTFLRYIAESLHSLSNAQNLLLRVESDQSKILMDYDPERLLQIVHNLLSNAIKFTPSGGRVVLRAELKDKWLHISVTDSGAGIPPEELPHLFERFFQARNQEYAKAGGSGIGLSLTRELVKAMGGEISVESRMGAGSTFFVKLPVTNNGVLEDKGSAASKDPATSHPTLPAKSTAKPGAPSPVTNEQNRYDILLVEDNPDVIEYLNACLKDHYNLDFAYNGQAGIEKALESVPDLIVSDVMMPIKDGFEVVDALKNDESTSHIPIVLLTARADVESRLAGLRRGADAYLSKPFHQEELLVTLENLLESRRKLQLKYQQNLLAAEVVPLTVAAADPEDAFLQNVRAIIAANYAHEDFGLPQLCQKIGMSRSQLFRKMKALTDIAPSDLIRSHRLNKAKTLLESGTANVAEAAWQVGFKDPSYFSKLYLEEFGELPGSINK